MSTSQDIVEGLVKALEASRIYVADAVARDGGIDNCQIEYRMDLEAVDTALAAYRASLQNDGWNEWKGGECPVEPGTQVKFKMRDGEVSAYAAGALNWKHEDEVWDIVAWRLAK
jgi:hypothetical protein